MLKQPFYSFCGVLILFFQFTFLSAQTSHCQIMKRTHSAPPGLYPNTENLRSDTVDILKYTINLEIGNATNKWINGSTAIRFMPKINNVNYIRLDLLQLIVDSVKENISPLLYSYNDSVLTIHFGFPKNITDTSDIVVYYKGQPKSDALWGGFYFDNSQGDQYAYNLGVGFLAKPHNFGRVWFPCFDNFVERSKYEFNITCDTLRTSYCNGLLANETINNAKRTRKWIMNDEIPTYLASVAVAKYTQVNWSVNTLTGTKPVVLAAVPADTTALKNGFMNLINCIHGYENRFGAYRWNRFGYCLVPFSSGAMEHATNIAYPRLATSIQYEAELMAHELSHHWWGNLITCETQEDMWINEGMATYSAYLFTEFIKGKAFYIDAVKKSHDKLIHLLHKKEGAFRAISGIPHNYTYGDHVYLKGADVAHTLRSYMGDSAFFHGIKYVMQQKQFQSINSIELRNLLQTNSGLNLVPFFDNWVLAGGWPHFSIDSVKYIQTGPSSYNAIVSIQQKLHGAPNLFNNVPLELSFFKPDWSRTISTVTMSGVSSTFTINLNSLPVYCALNYDSKISDATSSENKTIKHVTNVIWSLGKVFMPIKNAGADSSLIRVVHHYVKPDPFKNNPQNHKLSDQHYWSVEGILSPGFHSRIRLNYDGNKMQGGTFSYLDTLLTQVNDDSIHVFYRANAADDWKPVLTYTLWSIDAKTGFFELDTLKLGEYAFGNLGDTSIINSIKNQVKQRVAVKVYPVPAKDFLKIEMDKLPVGKCMVELLDLNGRIIVKQSIPSRKGQMELNNVVPGTYILRITNNLAEIYTQKIIIN
jgi:hypothetical protein